MYLQLASSLGSGINGNSRTTELDLLLIPPRFLFRKWN